MSALLAAVAAVCFGSALVTTRLGLRSLDARSGAAISIPTAASLLVIASPVLFDAADFAPAAAVVFAAVGFFYPAFATLLRFRSTDLLGPTITSTVSSTVPFFALASAAVWLDESIPARAVVATSGVIAGISLLSYKASGLRPSWRGWWLAIPLAATMIGGIAQTVIKAALFGWPSPYAAALIGYAASCATVFAINALPRLNRPGRSGIAVFWFACTGAVNGAGVLSLYAALNAGPVATVAPIVAAYPLITLLLSAAVLRDEPINLRVVAGASLTVASVGYLVAT